MQRRTLLKLFTVSPLTGVLFALRNPYRFHTVPLGGVRWIDGLYSQSSIPQKPIA